jgi:hypothetical protein
MELIEALNLILANVDSSAEVQTDEATALSLISEKISDQALTVTISGGGPTYALPSPPPLGKINGVVSFDYPVTTGPPIEIIAFRWLSCLLNGTYNLPHTDFYLDVPVTGNTGHTTYVIPDTDIDYTDYGAVTDVENVQMKAACWVGFFGPTNGQTPTFLDDQDSMILGGVVVTFFLRGSVTDVQFSVDMFCEYDMGTVLTYGTRTGQCLNFEVNTNESVGWYYLDLSPYLSNGEHLLCDGIKLNIIGVQGTGG